MKRIIAAVVLVLAPVTAWAVKTYSKGTGETWDCAKDANVRITLSKGTFGFLGECKQISVSGGKNAVSIASAAKVVVTGNDNMIDIEEVDAISVTGARNQITWKKAKSGDKPKISKGGSSNKVDQKQ